MTERSRTTRLGRRGFLKVGGAALGGIAAGGTVTAKPSRDRYIVQTTGRGSLGVEVIHDLSAVGLAVVRASTSELRRSSGVKAFAPDTVYELSLPTERVDIDSVSTGGESATDEGFYQYQWDKESQDIPAVQKITRGEGTRVAVIDSGIDASHPDLEHAVNTDLSEDFTGDGYGAGGPYGGYHGTHVAGIVAADDRNHLLDEEGDDTGSDVGVVGSAPGTEIVDCRVFSQTRGASFGDILAAMVYAAEIGSDAANLSLGAYPIPRGSYVYENEDGELVRERGIGTFYGRALNYVTAYGKRRGTVYVVSAGNDAADLQHDGMYVSLPNEAANVLSISATGPVGYARDLGFEWDYPTAPIDSPAAYTNYGTNAIDLGAPGGNYSIQAYLDDLEDDETADGDTPWFYDLVFNCVSNPVYDDDGDYLGSEKGWSWVAGTSMAAPQVAGAVALVKSVDPDATAEQVGRYLRNTASVPEGYDKRYYGAGLLDTLGAVESAN